MKNDILEDLLHQELRSLYSAEKQMCKALTKMAPAACHPKVSAVLKERLEESGGQIRRLERIAGLMQKSLEGTKCPGMRQLVEDEARESLLNADARNETYDAGLISAVRHFISYEIERYELASMLASRVGLDQVERLLRGNLNEQKGMSARLTRLAKALKNRRTAKGTLAASAASVVPGTLMASMRLMGFGKFGPAVA